MLHPAGPLPATVYWRRRAVLVLAVLMIFTLVGWALVALVRGSGAAAALSPSARGTAAPLPDTAASTTSPDPTTAAPTSTAVAAPVAPAAPVPADPATPTACADAAIGLTAQVAAPSYPVGQEPVFRILVTNTSAVACTRDLDAGLQQVLVYSADRATRLWSSNDCFPGKSVDAPTLKPGEVKTFSVKWSGTSSEPTCQAVRTPLPAGPYVAVVRLAGLTSPPVSFSLT